MNYAGLETIAKNHGAVKTKKFEQVWYLASHDFDADVQDGVCRALSAAYLARNFTRAIMNFEAGGTNDFDDIEKSAKYGDKTFFAALHSEGQQSEKDKSRFQTISALQKRYKKPGLITAEELIEAARKTMASVSAGMLHYVGYSEYGVGSVERDPPIPKTGESYWMLSVGEHMMAAVVRDKLLGTKAKFFDPNAGQAVFAEVGQLIAFLKEYLAKAKYTVCFFIQYKR